jgi:hypothetical protein
LTINLIVLSIESIEITEGIKGTEGIESIDGTDGIKGTEGIEGIEITEGIKGTACIEGSESIEDNGGIKSNISDSSSKDSARRSVGVLVSSISHSGSPPPDVYERFPLHATKKRGYQGY